MPSTISTMPDHPFHARLRMLRAKHRRSQDQVADTVGCAQSTVGTWERGPQMPSVPELAKLCDLFAVSADYLLGRTEFPTGVAPDSWVVDLDEYEKARPGKKWAAKVPRRHQIVDYDTMKDMERALMRRQKGGSDGVS